MSIKKQRCLLFFCIFCIFFVIFHNEIAYFLNFFRLYLQHWQNEYRRSVTYFLRALRHEHNWGVWWSLITVGFIYGIIHAAAPGHGKIIVSTFLLTQSSSYRSAIFLAVGGSLLQGLSAILWVTTTIGALQWLIRDVLQQIVWAERLSFLMIIVIGAYLMIISEQKHSTHCCSHHHQTYSAAILAIGLRPCSGSILALSVAASWGLWGAGIVMTLAISFGTAITVLTLALLTVFGYENFAKQLIIKESQLIKRWLVFIGGGILILLGGLMFINTFYL